MTTTPRLTLGYAEGILQRYGSSQDAGTQCVLDRLVGLVEQYHPAEAAPGSFQPGLFAFRSVDAPLEPPVERYLRGLRVRMPDGTRVPLVAAPAD